MDGEFIRPLLHAPPPFTSTPAPCGLCHLHGHGYHRLPTYSGTLERVGPFHTVDTSWNGSESSGVQCTTTRPTARIGSDPSLQLGRHAHELDAAEGGSRLEVMVGKRMPDV